jgi:propanediol utilization protein
MSAPLWKVVLFDGEPVRGSGQLEGAPGVQVIVVFR